MYVSIAGLYLPYVIGENFANWPVVGMRTGPDCPTGFSGCCRCLVIVSCVQLVSVGDERTAARDSSSKRYCYRARLPPGVRGSSAARPHFASLAAALLGGEGL